MPDGHPQAMPQVIDVDELFGTHRVLVEPLMQAVVNEMVFVLVQDGASVSFVVDQQPVGTLLMNRADEPFGITVRLGCPGRDRDHLDAVGGEDSIKGGGERGVPVTADRTGAQSVTQPGEFALKATVAPGWILLCQAQD
jgi:hypothetical protein